jgi:hypothetical protein
VSVLSLVRALVDGGYVPAAVIVVVTWLIVWLVRYLARVAPALVRAACLPAAVRRALNAGDKADRDQAFRVVQALIAGEASGPPPGGGTGRRARVAPPDGGQAVQKRVT